LSQADDPRVRVAAARGFHRWDLDYREAIDLQAQLAARLRFSDGLDPVRLVAGADVGFEDGGRVARAAVVVLDADTLETLDQAVARAPTRVPYIPGLLSFREIPVVLDAVAQLRCLPDLFICDCQGRAHPRRFGLACHLGLILDIPSIGAAKSRLLGSYGELPVERGAWVPLQDHGEVVGAVLRSRTGVSPLFVSSGHRISLDTAIHWVLSCAPHYRVPETTRKAHRLASH
jgi:deoxyribonuclease V